MRILRIVAALLGGTLALAALAVVVALLGLNTDAGRRLAERTIARASGGQVSIAGLAGNFPAGLRAARIEIRDGQGVWLTVEDAALDWSPMRLLAGEARIEALTAARVTFSRPPIAAASEPSAPGDLPVRVSLRRLHVDRLEGAGAAVSVEGSAQWTAWNEGQARLALAGLDRPGTYRLDGRIDGAGVQAQVQAEEPAQGLLSGAAGLPALGAIDIAASLDGPWQAVALKLTASAGPLRAHAAGTLDLNAWTGKLEIAADAPAMRPRPELAWQGIAVAAQVQGRLAAPEAKATMTLDGLEAFGAAVQRLSAQGSGHAGAAELTASADGVRLPGPQPLLLAAAPLLLTARAALEAPGRPVTFVLSHPLVHIDGSARTAGLLSADAAITLPDLAPLAAAGGVELQGRAALTVKAAQEAAGTRLDVDGNLAVTGGMAPLPALLGPDAALAVSAVLHGADVTLSRLQFDGRALSLGAEGGVRGGAVALDWRLGFSDLAALAGTVAGSLTAQGHAAGSADDLSLTAELTGELATAGFPRGPVRASVGLQGLPANPSGSVTAEGTLEGAPLALEARASRTDGGGLHVDITRADWRSSHADGAIDLPPGAALPLGAMALKMGDLGDFSGLLGQRLTGSIEASLHTEQQDGAPVAVLDLHARNAGLPGHVLAGEATLTARVRDPAGVPVTLARLDATGLRAGGIGGGLRLDASGRPDALVLGLAAELTGVAGSPLTAKAAASLDLPGQKLAVASAQAGWRGETLHLLAPARLAFGDGVAVDRARLGVRGAVLEVAGRLSPTLDLTASLHNLTAELVRIAAPGLNADGQLEASAKLGGTPALPTGTMRLAVTGLRLRGEAAIGLPAGALTADAILRGASARVDATLSAGRNRLTLAGSVPLAASGAMDLHAAGAVDLAIFDAILAANGRRVQGRLTMEAGLTGTIAAPRATGTITLAGGEVQDFTLGARLDHIEAVVEANGDTLRLARFAARAGKGSVAASGTLGLAAPMPVDLALTLHNASPLASDRLTAALDSDLSLRGALTGRMALAGKVTIQRAEIRIPERLPTGLAVLEVRRPGQPPPPPAMEPDIGLDVTLNAPSRLFVRGRGVDAELAGELHLGGSLATPQPSGSFTLRRGQVALAGASLDFSRGAVGFDGSGRIDPTLNFLASSTNANVVANLAITGYASAPKLTLSSTPVLPQDEVLAWLLFHKSTATLSPLQLAQIAQALAQVSGIGGGFDPLGRLRSGLGLDRLSVGSGEGGKGVAVEAGRYVASGVYVGVREDSAGTGTQAVVQVDLAKGLKLEATVGQKQDTTGASTANQDSGTSVGLTYQFEY